MRISAPAKINLYLHLTGQRHDGYHLLESLIAFPGFGDTLTLSAGSGVLFSLAMEGPYAKNVSEADNLVTRAASLLIPSATRKLSAKITLTKHIPLGSGMGGGSADGAAALRLLNAHWECGHDLTALQQWGLELGADVPACLHGRQAYISGIGETIKPVLHFPAVPLLLLNAGIPLATAEVFKQVSASEHSGAAAKQPGRFLDLEALVDFLINMRNDLEPAAMRLAPSIGETLAALRFQQGCLLARMSGSGATCFGIFAHPDLRDTAAKILASRHPDWWQCSTSISPHVAD